MTLTFDLQKARKCGLFVGQDLAKTPLLVLIVWPEYTQVPGITLR